MAQLQIEGARTFSFTGPTRFDSEGTLLVLDTRRNAQVGQELLQQRVIEAHDDGAGRVHGLPRELYLFFPFTVKEILLCITERDVMMDRNQSRHRKLSAIGPRPM